MTTPLTPEQNIGPYYRAVGIFLLFLLGATVLGFLAAVLLQVPLTDLVVKVLAGLAGIELLGALLIIVRPARFDDLFRTVIAALPFTRYGRPTEEVPRGG